MKEGKSVRGMGQPTYVLLAIGVFSFVVGVVGLVSLSGPVIGSLLIKAGLLYTLVGGAAVIMTRRENLYFGLTLLVAVATGIVWTSNVSAIGSVLLGTSAESPWIINLTIDLSGDFTEGIWLGFAASGVGFAFALAVASRRLYQWIAVGLIAVSLFPFVEYTINVLQYTPQTNESMIWPLPALVLLLLAGMVTLGIPLYRLGQYVRGNLISPADSNSLSRKPQLVAGILVFGTQLAIFTTMITIGSQSLFEVLSYLLNPDVLLVVLAMLIPILILTLSKNLVKEYTIP